MKKLFYILFFTFTVLSGIASAAIVEKTMITSWTYPVEEEAYIASFEIHDQDGELVVGGIPANMRTSTAKVLIDEERVLAYTLIARGKDGTTSTPSNMIIIQPKHHEITGVGTFTIKLE